MHDPGNFNANEIKVQLLTISDSRSEKDDLSGKLMKDYITASPFKLAGHRIVREDFTLLEKTYQKLLNNPQINVIISSGGTGLAGRDRTIEVISKIIKTELPGFGEIFRQLSYREIGPRAILSRALAGEARKKLIFAIPGSPAAVELAFEKIILEVLHHGIEIIQS